MKIINCKLQDVHSGKLVESRVYWLFPCCEDLKEGGSYPEFPVEEFVAIYKIPEDPESSVYAAKDAGRWILTMERGEYIAETPQELEPLLYGWMHGEEMEAPEDMERGIWCPPLE